MALYCHFAFLTLCVICCRVAQYVGENIEPAISITPLGLSVHGARSIYIYRLAPCTENCSQKISKTFSHNNLEDVLLFCTFEPKKCKCAFRVAVSACTLKILCCGYNMATIKKDKKIKDYDTRSCSEMVIFQPDLTAVMEYNLSAIADGKMDLEVFIEETKKMVLENIAFAEDSAPIVSEVLNGGGEGQDVPREECPVCRRKTLARKYSPKTKKHFWVCEEESCVHPTTEKPIFYADSRKKSVIKLCPQCGVPLNQVYSKKTKQQYWLCPNCNEFKKML